MFIIYLFTTATITFSITFNKKFFLTDYTSGFTFIATKFKIIRVKFQMMRSET